MLRPTDQYFLQQNEPAKSTLEFLRNHILQQNENITEAWQYKMPFYCYKGKRFCYLWTDKKTGLPYIGIVAGDKVVHPDLEKGRRSRMSILVIDPSRDIPINKIDNILRQALGLFL